MPNRILDTINKLAKVEQEETQFIAPLLPGSKVAVRVAKVVQILEIKPRAKAPGVYLIERWDQKNAKVIRLARRKEINELWSLLPSVHSVVIGEKLCIQALTGSAGLWIEGAFNVQLLEAQPFDTVTVKFDGENFWYAEDRREYAKVGAMLRQYLTEDLSPEHFGKVKIESALPAHYASYAIAWKEKHKNDLHTSKHLSDEDRIRLALKHVGVNLDSFSFSGETARVRFTDAGTQRDVLVQRKNLQVISSGICLSGRDRDFDLTSLVSVFRQRK